MRKAKKIYLKKLGKILKYFVMQKNKILVYGLKWAYCGQKIMTIETLNNEKNN